MIKRFDQFDDTTQTIKDILLELEDNGFNIEYKFKNNEIDSITISKQKSKFFIEEIEDYLQRVSRFLDKSIECEIQNKYGLTREINFHVFPNNVYYSFGWTGKRVSKIKLHIQ